MSDFVLLPWDYKIIHKNIIAEIFEEENKDMDTPTARVMVVLCNRYGERHENSKWMGKDIADQMFLDLWERLNR